MRPESGLEQQHVHPCWLEQSVHTCSSAGASAATTPPISFSPLKLSQVRYPLEKGQIAATHTHPSRATQQDLLQLPEHPYRTSTIGTGAAAVAAALLAPCC